jgi:general stress protein YciG
MSGTIAGGRAAAETNLKRYGEDLYKQIGQKGGKAGFGHKFGHGKVDPSVIGAKGGKVSKRGKAVKVKPVFIVQEIDDKKLINRLRRLFTW